jgi:hypothetical protein
MTMVLCIFTLKMIIMNGEISTLELSIAQRKKSTDTINENTIK